MGRRIPGGSWREDSEDDVFIHLFFVSAIRFLKCCIRTQVAIEAVDRQPSSCWCMGHSLLAEAFSLTPSARGETELIIVGDRGLDAPPRISVRGKRPQSQEPHLAALMRPNGNEDDQKKSTHRPRDQSNETLNGVGWCRQSEKKVAVNHCFSRTS